MSTSLMIKRVFDIIASSFILLIFFPLWLVIAALVKISSPGPVFFIQARPGYHGEIIHVFKYRSMKINSDIMVKGKEVSSDDNRITAVGRVLRRSKIDEIPQLLNVLKGEMSIVGPRPERIASLDDYTESISVRLNMKPGMTGLAQVSGNIYLPLESRYKLDVYYVENFRLSLDARILFRTIGVLLLGEERYASKPLSCLPSDFLHIV